MIKITTRIAVCLVILTGISFVGLTIPSGHAATSTATASVTVASACTLSSTVNTNHTATIYNGNYQDDIGKTTLKVVCNDNSGFSIYAIGYSNDTFGNNKLVANVGGTLSPTNDIVTGTATSGNTSNWAMKITPIAGTYSPTIGGDTNGSFANYHIVPDKYVKVATFNSTTDATIGSSIEATYRAYVSGTQPAGTYTGKVKYTMVHPANAEPNQPRDCVANTICYWPNGDGEVVDNMGDQMVAHLGGGESTEPISGSTYIQFWPSNFQRKGYGFAGWSDKFDWVLNQNDEDGNGTGANIGYHIYGPEATIDNSDSIHTNGLSLYAVWVPSAGYLQDWDYCSSLKVGEVTALTDRRDSQTYAIAKLKDGKCWMIENLRLNNQYTSGEYYKNLAQGYASNFVGLADSETANFNTNGVANSLYSTDDSTMTPPIAGTYATYRFPRYNNSNTINSVPQMTNNTLSYIYSYGNYYTRAAAIADTGYYSTNNQGITNTSICPNGWHLPSGGWGTGAADSDYWKLGVGIMGFAPSNGLAYRNEMNTGGKTAHSAFRDFPNNFLTNSGRFYNDSISPQYGHYHTNTTSDGRGGYRLFFWNDSVYPGSSSANSGYNGTYYRSDSGYSIRCTIES